MKSPDPDESQLIGLKQFLVDARERSVSEQTAVFEGVAPHILGDARQYVGQTHDMPWDAKPFDPPQARHMLNGYRLGPGIRPSRHVTKVTIDAELFCQACQLLLDKEDLKFERAAASAQTTGVD
jgi:hypothetical protein